VYLACLLKSLRKHRHRASLNVSRDALWIGAVKQDDGKPRSTTHELISLPPHPAARQAVPSSLARDCRRRTSRPFLAAPPHRAAAAIGCLPRKHLVSTAGPPARQRYGPACSFQRD